MSTRWQQTAEQRGDDYDARWQSMVDAGENVHGEADLVEALLTAIDGRTVLDAGCGTGRVAIELARRGFTVTGVDADPAMLASAGAKAPDLLWVEADLAQHDSAALPAQVDLVLLAGNVMIFVEPGTEGRVLSNLAGRLGPRALLVAGFSVHPEHLSLQRYDGMARAAGLHLVHRWATWDRQPFDGGDYAVSVHALQ